MDDLFIGEEVTVKTEPGENRTIAHFEDNLSEKFLLDEPHSEDLLAYLNHCNPKDKHLVKKENFDPQNIFESANHFMDPDTMIAHYEEVVQDINTQTAKSNSILGTKDKRQRKTVKKKKVTKNDTKSPRARTRQRANKTQALEEDDDERDGFSFECSLCMFTTLSEAELKHHMLDHIGGPDTDTFVEESHNGDAYTCLFCPFVSVSSDLFRDHIKFKHSGSIRTSGHNIKNQVNSLSSLPSGTPASDDEIDVPLLQTGGNKSHMCKLCLFAASSKEELNKHLVKCHSEKLLECSHCSFVTFYKPTLKRHELRHEQEQSYQCKQCNFSTFNLSTLNNHEATHSEQKPYSCDECTFSGKTRESLRQHKKIHSEDLPFACSFCQYKAGKRSRIIRHERVHTGERPYACPHCSFRCNQGSTLKIHIRRHTGEKPYGCPLCTYRTVSKCSLNAHLKKHNSSRVEFICQICDQIYNNYKALKKHEKMHDEQIEEDGSLKEVVNKRRKSDYLAANVAMGINFSPKRERTKRSSEPKRRKRRKREPVLKQELILKQEPEQESDQELEVSLASPKMYRCTMCPYSCDRFLELSDHMSTHKRTSYEDEYESVPKKYRCTPCNVFFSRKREMRAHMKERHEVKREQDDGSDYQ